METPQPWAVFEMKLISTYVDSAAKENVACGVGFRY
jgi:hypothetical protein